MKKNKIKQITLSLCLFVFSIYASFPTHAQKPLKFEYERFELQILTYTPVKRPNVSVKEFNYAEMIITETKEIVKGDPANFGLADYFNILTAFLTLKEGSENIYVAFEKFRDANGSCEYFLSFEDLIQKTPKYDVVRDQYSKKLMECKSDSSKQEKFDVAQYCEKNNLDCGLVKMIMQVNLKDQQHRTQNSKESLVKQKEQDEENQQAINMLYKNYNSYIGRSLVGRKFQHVMWAVIQHSNLEMMEDYLPVIHQAVQQEELDEGPLKLLIDRYYGLKYVPDFWQSKWIWI